MFVSYIFTGQFMGVFVDKKNMAFGYDLTDLLHFILTKTKKSIDQTETIKPTKKFTCTDF